MGKQRTSARTESTEATETFDHSDKVEGVDEVEIDEQQTFPTVAETGEGFGGTKAEATKGQHLNPTPVPMTPAEPKPQTEAEKKHAADVRQLFDLLSGHKDPAAVEEAYEMVRSGRVERQLKRIQEAREALRAEIVGMKPLDPTFEASEEDEELIDPEKKATGTAKKTAGAKSAAAKTAKKTTKAKGGKSTAPSGGMAKAEAMLAAIRAKKGQKAGWYTENSLVGWNPGNWTQGAKVGTNKGMFHHTGEKNASLWFPGEAK